MHRSTSKQFSQDHFAQMMHLKKSSLFWFHACPQELQEDVFFCRAVIEVDLPAFTCTPEDVEGPMEDCSETFSVIQVGSRVCFRIEPSPKRTGDLDLVWPRSSTLFLFTVMFSWDVKWVVCGRLWALEATFNGLRKTTFSVAVCDDRSSTWFVDSGSDVSNDLLISYSEGWTTFFTGYIPQCWKPFTIRCLFSDMRFQATRKSFKNSKRLILTTLFSWSCIRTSCSYNFLRGPFQLVSKGCKRWLECGGMHKSSILFSAA